MTWACIMMVALTDRQLTDDARDTDEEQIGSWHLTPRKKNVHPQREKHITLGAFFFCVCAFVRAPRRRRLLSRYTSATRSSIARRRPTATNHYFISSILDGLQKVLFKRANQHEQQVFVVDDRVL